MWCRLDGGSSRQWPMLLLAFHGLTISPGHYVASPGAICQFISTTPGSVAKSTQCRPARVALDGQQFLRLTLGLRIIAPS
jgi:hypothetical protein